MYHQFNGFKNFPNTMLLKVNHFERFLNQSNVDKLAINSMRGCNCKNNKIKNNLIIA